MKYNSPEELKNLDIDIDIIDKIAGEQPEKLAELMGMFKTYILKTVIFNAELNVPKADIQTAGEQLRDFIEVIMWKFTEHWCNAEEDVHIIEYLENEIVRLGGDLDAIREGYANSQNKVMEEQPTDQPNAEPETQSTDEPKADA